MGRPSRSEVLNVRISTRADFPRTDLNFLDRYRQPVHRRARSCLLWSVLPIGPATVGAPPVQARLLAPALAIAGGSSATLAPTSGQHRPLHGSQTKGAPIQDGLNGGAVLRRAALVRGRGAVFISIATKVSGVL